MTPETHLEVKAELESKASVAEVGGAFNELMTTFDDFRETNDQADVQIEKRGHVDPLTADKLDRLDRAMTHQQRRVDELQLKGLRPQKGGYETPRAPRSAAGLQHKAAFDGYVRKGESGNLRQLEAKALSVGSDPDGGYLVPDETETTSTRAVRDISPIRAIAGIRQVSGSVYKKPFSISRRRQQAGSRRRRRARRPTRRRWPNSSFPTMELYAMPAATSSLLDDSAVNIDEWMAEEVRDRLRRAGGHGLRHRQRHQQAEGLPRLHQGRQRLVELGQHRLHRHRRGRRLPGVQPGRQADRPHLFGEVRLSRQRHVRLEPRHAGRDPQDEGRRRQLPVAAGGASPARRPR